MSSDKVSAIIERIKPEVVANIKRRHDLNDQGRLLDEMLSKSSVEIIGLIGAALELLMQAGEEASSQDDVMLKKQQLAKEQLDVLHRDATLATLIGNLEYLLLDPKECEQLVESLPAEARANLLQVLEDKRA